MKRLSTLLLLLTLIGASIEAQSVRFPYDPRPAKEIVFPVLDTTLLRLRYQMTWVPDTLKPDETRENIMMLQIGHTISKWSDYHIFIGDSTWNAMVRTKSARSEVLTRVTSIEARAIPIKIFRNLPKGRTTTLDRIPFNTYRYEEDILEPVWQLNSGTEMVCGYHCNLATTTFLGRNYTVWYTPEIPVGQGPWKLGGLPGMILKATDDKGHYTFECIAIEQPSWIDPIYNISYRPFDIRKEQFFRLQKRYYDNPAAQVENTGMIKSELPASARKARPYNPIELSE